MCLNSNSSQENYYMKYIIAALAALFPLVLSAQTYTNEVASIVAYGAIAYGAWTIYKSE